MKGFPAHSRLRAGFAALALALAGCAAPSGTASAPGPAQAHTAAGPAPGAAVAAAASADATAPTLVARSREEGLASWYGPGFAGRPTASGEAFDPAAMTAAHKVLPLGALARVTRLDTGESVTVRINDRGPFVEGRVIDLSRAAAQRLGFLEDGLAPVRVEHLGPADPRDRAARSRLLTPGAGAAGG